jgi:hypothetical protein
LAELVGTPPIPVLRLPWPYRVRQPSH